MKRISEYSDISELWKELEELSKFTRGEIQLFITPIEYEILNALASKNIIFPVGDFNRRVEYKTFTTNFIFNKIESLKFEITFDDGGSIGEKDIQKLIQDNFRRKVQVKKY